MRRRHALLAAALLGALAFYAWRPTETVPPAAPEAAAPASAGAEPAFVPVEVAGANPATGRGSDRLESLRRRVARSSLRGTVPDGEVQLDAVGALVPDAGLRRLFDYWLALSGEFADEEIRVLLHADVADRHGEAVARDALVLFDRYLGLRAQLAATPPAADLEIRLRNLSAARRAWFGADAQAMFGAEESQAAYTLARQHVLEADLDAADRARQLAELESRRPAPERRSERDATAAVLATEQTRQLDALGADEATRHAERAGLWGGEAADRLAVLDAERARWDARLAAFARERERLLADERLDAATRQREIDTLLRRDFSEPERARVEALARTGGLPPGG